MHCIDAPCVAACATGASYKRDDGIVVVDYDVCIGCGTCIEVCPYGARTINASEAYYFDAEEAAPYETEGPQRVNVAEKCIFCYPRIDRGLEPACVHNCPGGARFFGDVEDPESAISQKIAQEGDAVHNLSGTSFYYVPFSTMPADLLPMPGFYKNESADAGKGEGEQAEGAADASPLMVAGGVAAVAVVGAGVGVAVKRSRSKRPAGPDASQVETETQREEGLSLIHISRPPSMCAESLMRSTPEKMVKENAASARNIQRGTLPETKPAVAQATTPTLASLRAARCTTFLGVKPNSMATRAFLGRCAAERMGFEAAASCP